MTFSFPILQETKLGNSSFSASLSHCSPLSFFLSNSPSCIYVKILDPQFQLHLPQFCLLAYPHAPLSASWKIKSAATPPPPKTTPIKQETKTNKKHYTPHLLNHRYILIYIYMSAIIIFWIFETKMSVNNYMSTYYAECAQTASTVTIKIKNATEQPWLKAKHYKQLFIFIVMIVVEKKKSKQPLFLVSKQSARMTRYGNKWEMKSSAISERRDTMQTSLFSQCLVMSSYYTLVFTMCTFSQPLQHAQRRPPFQAVELWSPHSPVSESAVHSQHQNVSMGAFQFHTHWQFFKVKFLQRLVLKNNIKK